jgi:class 3 adenylate cyclase/uncharacterized RDD family membrane protein YckC
MPDTATRHLTILLTDIKGFTDKTSHRSREQIMTMLDEHRSVVLPVLEARGGRLIKTIGDAFLMTFESPTNAVLAGIAVQGALAKRNEGRPPDDRLELRIAINAGEVNVIDGDVFGEAVNITARIESIAEANQVYFTEAVYLAMNKTEVPSSEVGLVHLKGIPEKIRVYKVRTEQDPRMSAAPAPASGSGRQGPAPKAVFADAKSAPLPRRGAALALDLAFCALLVGGFVVRGTRVARVPRLVQRKAPPPPTKPEPTAESLGAGGMLVHNIGELFSGGPRAKKRGSPSFTVVYDERTERPWGMAAVGFAVLWFAYNLAFLLLGDATLGQLALGLRVVASDGAAPKIRQRALRSLVSVPSAGVLLAGYLWALVEPQGRGWHDLAAGTRVAAR